MSTGREREVIIIGAGGHGSELYSYIQDLATQKEALRLVGFVDENKPRGPWGGAEILGRFEDLRAFLGLHPDSIFHYITAVGDNRIRRQFVCTVVNLDVQNLV